MSDQGATKVMTITELYNLFSCFQFMKKNGILCWGDGIKRIAENELVALFLMIAESKSHEK